MKKYRPDTTFIDTPDLQKIVDTLTESVKIRISNSDREIGYLLSGGLDSSLICGIAAKLQPNKRLKTFSIGFDDKSTDLIAARKVAKFINSEHTELVVDIKDGFAAIKDVIYHFETYDITTIRAGTPMYLLCKYIAEKTNIKVLVNGDVSDEVSGSYLYFGSAPSIEDFHNESVRLLENIHQFDALRADRATAAHGLELRLPFGDQNYVKLILSINPTLRTHKKGYVQEKKILRDAFSKLDILPNEILYRRKEAFSDGVSHSWVDEIKKYCNSSVSDEIYKQAKILFPINTPSDKESLYYRFIFSEHYPHRDNLICEYWRPKWTGITDPSARYLTNY